MEQFEELVKFVEDNADFMGTGTFAEEARTIREFNDLVQKVRNALNDLVRA